MDEIHCLLNKMLLNLDIEKRMLPDVAYKKKKNHQCPILIKAFLLSFLQKQTKSTYVRPPSHVYNNKVPAVIISK